MTSVLFSDCGVWRQLREQLEIFLSFLSDSLPTNLQEVTQRRGMYTRLNSEVTILNTVHLVYFTVFHFSRVSHF